MDTNTTCPAFIADILRQCTTNPERIAIIDGSDQPSPCRNGREHPCGSDQSSPCGSDQSNREHTYGELHEIIRKTSGYIKTRGIKPGSFIVISLPNCMEYLAVEYGAWLAGCAVAPVSPLYPEARIEYISRHCDSPLTIDTNVLEEIRKAEPLDICEPNPDIAALFYTSGSTGNPKGVIHTFDTLSQADHFREIHVPQPDDCFALGAPFSFIAWVLTVPFLRTGARVKLIDRDTMTDARKLQSFFDRGDVTGTFLGPSALRQISLKGNTGLQFIITGSERVSNLQPEADYKLYNIYGMTETVGPAVIFEIDRPYQNTPVGKPYSNLEMKIMEDGEICLRGPLSPGYFKDPERSAELWKGGWLHTGDLGRLLPDGNAEYVNRKDWMVKINGQRVETGEIIEVIKQMPGILNATAKGFTAPDGHQYIVAYYVTEKNVDGQEIKEFISRKLAPYMIPSHFVKMSSLPLNFNGKVDIKSLQSPAEERLKRDIVAPATENEKLLCKAFESALGISPISVLDDFFSLGGDSIRVMQVQVACPELNLSSSLIFRKKTVRAICESLEEEVTPEKSQDTDVFPLSKTQSGIFVECMARRGEAVYNNPILYKFTDPVDADKLASACTKALKAHPNVFATIRMDENGNPVQVRNSTDIRLSAEQISETDLKSSIPNLMQPFDILSDRLFRIRIFKTESAVWLFTDFHHIIFDGTSNTIFLEDVEKAYKGEEPVAETYTGFDVARDEQCQRESSLLEESRDWNIGTFSKPDRTSLPDPDLFSDTTSFGKFEIRTAISAGAFAKAAEKLGVTENVLATAAFGHMLGACSHATESAFATIYNGRKSLKTARTMSMMVKTLPVFCQWGKDTRTGEYLENIRSQMAGTMAHDLFSFSEICAATAYDSRVIFSYQDELLERNSLCGAACSMHSLLDNATGEPFTVQLYKADGALTIRTEYRSNMFSEGYIKKFVECYGTILSALLTAEKDTPLASIPLVTQAEKESLITTGTGKTLKYDRLDTIVKAFRRNVAARPDSTAVVDADGKITYRELDLLSDRLATILIKEGVNPEDFAALMQPRLRHFTVSYMACFKCGAAYVPMDSEYPIDRLQYMIENSGAKVLLTTHEIYDEKSREGTIGAPKVIFVDEVLEDSGIEVDAGIDRARPDGLAYMIYTSGTTGRPKGVMIEHRALTNLLYWFSDNEKLKQGVRIAEHASFSFDGSVPDLMTPLFVGGELHILPSELRKDLAGMYRYFCENRIDGVILTTQLGLTMLKMYDLKLKYLMLGGEKMTGKFHTGTHIYNGYGPTEFTVCSSFYLIDPSDTPDNIPIGKPVPNTFSGIVDPCGRLLPAGIPGELILAGIQLSRGYWQREDTTAERFVDCTFLSEGKMYRTGDLTKWSADGELLYLGRIDTQVKLRGFRIELGEIESDLRKFEGIRAGVVAVKQIGGVQHLCAYYESESPIDEESLRAFLAGMLTDYMVPTAYVRMDALPMTPNGKVDMKRLPVPEIKAAEMVPPEGEIEEKLFEIVSDQLGTSDFGVTSNLISLGLTSLGAITLSLQIERKAGLSIPSPKILECPTIRQWKEYLGAVEEVVSPYEKRDSYPMTDNQTGIYIDWEQSKDSLQYNVPMVLRFEGVTPETVAAAVRSFAENHPYIKAHLQTIDGQVMQVRCDEQKVEVPVSVLDKAPDKDFFQSLLKPFDLFQGPLFRFDVFSFGDTTWLLSDFHHIIFDGGSETIFSKEITDFVKGGKIEPEKFSAFDFALFYNDWKASEEFNKAGQYFTTLLEGSVPATLPSTVPAEGNGSATISETVSRQKVRELCRKAGVTENALFLSAVTEVLHRFTRENVLSILTVSGGRSMRELERTCGMFVQTLPVVSHKADRSVGESLKMMQDQVAGTLSRDKYPYTKIVEATGLKTDILLVYEGGIIPENEQISLSLDTAKLPLSIIVIPGADSVKINFEYDLARFSGTDVSMLASAVRCFVENIGGAGTDVRIGSIACVSEKDSESLISLGSGPKMDVPEGTIVSLVRKHATDHPDDPAVSDLTGTLSFHDLDSRSDLLAGILIGKGLREGAFVGIMLPRCREYAVAYLAVFKAGGAYVPMDHEYPKERLEYMLEDSKSEFLITSRSVTDGSLQAPNTIYVEDIDFKEPAAPVDKSRSEGLAYMIYTSGTTGKPKGVMVPHRGVMNMVHWNSATTGTVRGSRVAEHASFSFDASVIDLMTTIAFGAHLFIIPEDCRKDPEALYRYLCDNRIEVTTTSTQLGMMMLSSYKLPLRCITMGGEKLTGRYDKSIKVINGYGPTEFTVCSSYHVCDADRDGDNIPIGRPVPNSISAIVDPDGQLLPEGVPGEIVLIGPQLAKGYWNKPDVTAKRFVPCPFIPGADMYRTGDLARWNSEGELLFMGRIDTQVKLRGFRIELGEIESRIAAFSGVTAAVAQVREIGGVQHLCAYFTASSEIDTGALKASLSKILTSYMVPDSLMQIDELPLTPNGKVDVKKLPEPVLTQGSSTAFEAPEGETEILIADTFKKVLGLETAYDRNASFFSMGGTSLLVMKVIVALSDGGFSVTYGDVFKYPTPRALAAFIEGLAAGRGVAGVTDESGAGQVSEAPSFDKGEDGFDYSDINRLLSTNDVGSLGEISQLDANPVGDVLLLGSTGYLGIHVLHELLSGNHSGKVWCLIRPKKGVTCEGRLKSYLMYYFDKTFSELIGSRLMVVEGDMTDDDILGKLEGIKVDTVINCAANVKHFAAGDEIEKINLGGTEKLIEYCLKTGSRLIHTSTHSISGQTENGAPHTMLESELYFGQKLMTKYQTSKFAAERAILDACAKNGLKAKIMRLGNLMPRFTDGEFQINIENNGFMARMRAYYLIGCIASSHLHGALEFAPIDVTADAILTLARTPDRFTVFHPFNNHTIYVDDVVAVMRKCGLEIKITDDAGFNEKLAECLKDDHLNPFITTLLAYGSHNNYVMNSPSLDFTVSILNAMDWRWPITGTRYLSDAFEKMISLEYFDK